MLLLLILACTGPCSEVGLNLGVAGDPWDGRDTEPDDVVLTVTGLEVTRGTGRGSPFDCGPNLERMGRASVDITAEPPGDGPWHVWVESGTAPPEIEDTETSFTGSPVGVIWDDGDEPAALDFTLGISLLREDGETTYESAPAYVDVVDE